MSEEKTMDSMKLEYDHANNDDYHDWVHIGGYVLRDSIGRKIGGGTYRWLVVICNNTSCPARAIVNEKWFSAEVQQRFPLPKMAVTASGKPRP